MEMVTKTFVVGNNAVESVEIHIEVTFTACFLLISCFGYSSTVETEATCSSETSVDLQQLHDIISYKIKLYK
jgi:hypothetical protein